MVRVTLCRRFRKGQAIGFPSLAADGSPFSGFDVLSPDIVENILSFLSIRELRFLLELVSKSLRQYAISTQRSIPYTKRLLYGPIANPSIYLVGGWCCRDNVSTAWRESEHTIVPGSACERVTPETGQSVAVPSMQLARAGVSSEVIDDFLFAFGGVNTQGRIMNSVEVLNTSYEYTQPEKYKWRDAQPMCLKRNGAASVLAAEVRLVLMVAVVDWADMCRGSKSTLWAGKAHVDSSSQLWRCTTRHQIAGVRSRKCL